jgi:hypothetical protein
MLFLYRPRETRMPFSLPRNRMDQAAYNRTLQAKFEASRRVPPPVATVHAPVAPLDALSQLGQLHQSGVLSDDEFAAAKARLLAR